MAKQRKNTNWFVISLLIFFAIILTTLSGSVYAAENRSQNAQDDPAPTPTHTPTPLPPPVANFEVTHIANGEFHVVFKGTGTIDGFLFDMGDQQGASDETDFTYTYTEAGTYTIVLTVWGAEEYTSAGQTITVEFPIIADFEMSYTGDQAPLDVTFNNQSTGEVTSTLWEFGDGGTSTEDSPLHTFNAEGTYTIKLIVSGPHGESSHTALLTIGANQSQTLDPSFETIPATCTAPCSVTFTDTSSGAVTSREWNFGNGDSGTEEIITISYPDAGTYDVLLTISDGVDTVSVSGQVIVSPPSQAPSANFSVSPDSGQAPLLVAFTDLSTGAITAWSWAFGDGEESSAREPEHTYLEEGAYIAVLTVNGPDGVGQFQKTIYVSSASSEVQAAFTPLSQAPANPMTYVFDSGDSTGDIASYAWDFGDSNTSTETNPQHTYTDEGIYSVTLAITGTDGSTSSAVVQVSVIQYQLPTADFSPKPGYGDAPLDVDFRDESMPGTVPIISWYWEFGDGTNSNEQNPSHTYTLPGDYDVTLTIRDENDNLTTHNDVVHIKVATAHAKIACSTDAAFVGDIINFTDNSWGLPGVAWDWDFGDGNFSTLQNPDYAYSTPGDYEVFFTVEDANGHRDTDTDTCKITIIALDDVLARFSVSDQEGPIPHDVSFTENSLGDIASYAWTFGDGRTSNLRSPDAITYPNIGSFEINLTVVGISGKTSTATKIVSALEPLAITVDAQPTLGVAPMRINLSGDANGAVWSWKWDLGNGVIRWGKDVSYVYMSPGDYEVVLTAKGPAGEAVKTINIRVVEAGDIQAAFRANPYGGLAPLETCFSSLSSGEITGYQWDFGDGSTGSGKNVCHTYGSEGDYRIIHKVSGPAGIGEAVTTIRVFDPSLDLINVSFNSEGGGVACFFIDDAGLADFQWFFGDNESSSLESPCHKFDDAGDFFVYLVAKRTTGEPVVGILPITLLDSGQIVDTPVDPPTPTPTPDSGGENPPNDSHHFPPPPTNEASTPTPLPGDESVPDGAGENSDEAGTPTPVSSHITPPSIPLNACGMTLYGQDTSYSCLSASLCTVLSASHNMGADCASDIRKTMEEAGVMDAGGAALEIAPLFLEAYGRNEAEVKYALSYEEIAELHEQGYQIVLPLEIAEGSVLHSVVVVDITDTEITYGDPRLGIEHSIARENFDLWDGTALVVPGAEYCSVTPITDDGKPEADTTPATLLLLLGGAAVATMTAIAAGDLGKTTKVSGVQGKLVSNTAVVHLMTTPGGRATGGVTVNRYPRGTTFTAHKRCYVSATRNSYPWWVYQQMSDGSWGWMAPDWSNININALPVDCSNTKPPTTPPGTDPIMGSPLPIPDNTPLFGLLPLPIVDGCPKLNEVVRNANKTIENSNKIHRVYEKAKRAAKQAWDNYRYAKKNSESLFHTIQANIKELDLLNGVIDGLKSGVSFLFKEASKAEDYVRSGDWKSTLSDNKLVKTIIKFLPASLFKIVGSFTSWFKWFTEKIWNYVPRYLRSAANNAINWIKDKASKFYNVYRNFADNHDSERKKLQQKQKEKGNLLERIRNLPSKEEWANRARKYRQDAQNFDDETRRLKRERDAAIQNRNNAVNLVYRYRGECEDQLGIAPRFSSIAKELHSLTGVSEQDWLNASDETLGRFDKATDMTKMRDRFTKMKDWGVPKSLRKQIANNVVHGSWDENHVWRLTQSVKDFNDAGKVKWIQHGLDLDALTGVSAYDWINAPRSALGDNRPINSNKEDIVVKLQERFAKMKDWGISKDLRKQIANNVVHGSWNEWHVWKLIELTKGLGSADRTYWIQYGVDHDITQLENELEQSAKEKEKLVDFINKYTGVSKQTLMLLSIEKLKEKTQKLYEEMAQVLGDNLDTPVLEVANTINDALQTFLAGVPVLMRTKYESIAPEWMKDILGGAVIEEYFTSAQSFKLGIRYEPSLTIDKPLTGSNEKSLSIDIPLSSDKAFFGDYEISTASKYLESGLKIDGLGFEINTALDIGKLFKSPLINKFGFSNGRSLCAAVFPSSWGDVPFAVGSIYTGGIFSELGTVSKPSYFPEEMSVSNKFEIYYETTYNFCQHLESLLSLYYAESLAVAATAAVVIAALLIYYVGLMLVAAYEAILAALAGAAGIGTAVAAAFEAVAAAFVGLNIAK